MLAASFRDIRKTSVCLNEHIGKYGNGISCFLLNAVEHTPACFMGKQISIERQKRGSSPMGISVSGAVQQQHFVERQLLRFW